MPSLNVIPASTALSFTMRDLGSKYVYLLFLLISSPESRESRTMVGSALSFELTTRDQLNSS